MSNRAVRAVSNQIKSFLLVYGAVKATMNDQGLVWVYGKGHWGVSFCVGGCVLREWVVGGCGLDGYFGEQGLPAGIQECLEEGRRSLDNWLVNAVRLSSWAIY